MSSGEFESWTRRALALLAREGRPLDVLEWAGATTTPGLIDGLPTGSRLVTLASHPNAVPSLAAPGVERLLFVPPGEAARAPGYAVFPAQLGRTFDLVVVRGAARASCTQIGCMLLSAKGVLIVDREGDPDLAPPRDALALNGAGAHVAVIARDASVRQALEALAHSPAPVASPRTRAVMFNTYYPAFLAAHYRACPGLERASYAEQLASLQARLFGDSDFYSTGLRAAGWAADDIVVNCEPLQRAWARENGHSPDRPLLEIALEQIKRTRPDVVYIQDLGLATQPLLAAMRPHTELLVGQIASPISPQTHYPSLDVVVTSFPHFAKRFREAGICAYHQPLAFEPRVLAAAALPKGAARPHPLTFVGGISKLHSKGTVFLDQLARKLPIEFWGYGADELPTDSPIRSRHHGEVWGDDMFRVLASSSITVNRHVDVAETWANNMRLFEATGCGALLVTDHKDNLDDLFEIGREVVAYRSPEECVALIEYYLAHPAEASRIAAAGQARTLRDHTYAARMRDTADFLDAHVRRKRRVAKGASYVPSNVSTGHVALAPGGITPELLDAWKDKALPARQRALVDGELGDMYRKPVPPLPYDVLRASLAPLVREGDSILEVGCSSGYYAEVLRYLLNVPIDFTGVDYSPAMIAMARDLYPATKFLVGDGGNLPFPNGSFDVAITSSVLLHVRDYPLHIAETTRVSRRIVVAHRIPVCRQRPTTFLKKRGYDVEMLEIVFNERELVDLFLASGLELIDGLQYHADERSDTYGVTYVFRKR